MRPYFLLVLLAVTAPVFAQAPSSLTPPAAPIQADAPPAPAAVPAAITNPVLDSLIHRSQIVSITRQDGKRFLGRVVGGDHGIYIVQTFHFAGPPRAKVHTIGSGRNRRMVRTETSTTIKDDTALRLLVAGVAGTNVHPREIQGERQMLTGQDVRLIQALSPPSLKPTATPTAAVSPTASPMAWTLTTIWPTTEGGAPFPSHKHHHRRKATL